jgi:hypothetical protein
MDTENTIIKLKEAGLERIGRISNFALKTRIQ